METQRAGDDGGGCLEDALSQGRGSCGLRRDAEVADVVGQRPLGDGLPGPAAGEEPAAVKVGARGRTGPLFLGLEEQLIERFGDGCGRLAQTDDDLPVGVTGDVVEGEADDSAGRLRVEQHQAGRHLQPGGIVAVEDLAHEFEPTALRQHLPAPRLLGGQVQARRPPGEVAGGLDSRAIPSTTATGWSTRPWTPSGAATTPAAGAAGTTLLALGRLSLG